MSKYILITEAALDFCLTNNRLGEDFLPLVGDSIKCHPQSNEIDGYFAASEPSEPYFSLINKQCLVQISAMNVSANDIYRRIARVLKGFKSPPVHLPRQWSEYHRKNLIAFFALSRGISSLRWIADLNGDVNGVRFDILASASTEVDLDRYEPTPWPASIEGALKEIASRRFKSSTANNSSTLTPEVDLKAIGSSSIVNNLTYEEWKRRLTQNQESILTQPIDCSIRIVGPAGSGKTLALCMKAMQISRDTSVISKGKKILVATHSWAMAERIDGILDALNGGTPPEGITTFPLLSLLQLHAGHIGQKRMDVIGEDSSEGRSKSVDIIRRILSTHNVIDENGMSPWLANGLRASEDSRSRLELIVNLYDEISGVLTASGVSSDDADSISEYFSNSREDWMPPFVTQADKEFVISIYRGFTQELIDMSCITTDQFVLDSIRILETFTWRMRKETEGYDYIMVDELQLFDPQERSALELLGRSRKGVPFITSEDPSQGIFSALNTRPKSVQNEPIYLDTVHRFNKEIFDLVYFIYRKFPLNNISLKIAQNQAAQEDRPRLYMRRSEDDAIALACKLVAEKNTSSINSDNICVVTLGDVDNKITDCLESLKLPTIRMTSFDDVEQLAYSKRSIVVAPWQYVGGCQFTHVFVVTATLETPESQFAKLKELTSVYLSCSRAIESLTFISSGYTPSVIKDAMGHGLIIQQQ